MLDGSTLKVWIGAILGRYKTHSYCSIS